MSRGGRGGGRGGKRGPDLSWQDEDPNEPIRPVKNVPGPMFPDRHLVTPKCITRDEKASVKSLRSIHERIRSGPLYTVLEPSTLLDDKGKANPRAGFDPFNDQERFTKRYHRPRRTVPSLTERGGYTLRLFPLELWPILDPKHLQKEYWDTLSEELKARVAGTSRSLKRKRTDKLRFEDNDPLENENQENSGSEDEDGIISGNKRRKLAALKSRKEDPTSKQAKQKKGLDAEDDYGDTENPQNEDENAPVEDEEPQDSEYETEEEDDGADDYNAEQYFDDGEGDDFADADDDPGEREFYS